MIADVLFPKTSMTNTPLLDPQNPRHSTAHQFEDPKASRIRDQVEDRQ